jgi:hypothetical protein
VIPNFKTVTLTNGAILTCRKYSRFTDMGGLVVFKVERACILAACSGFCVGLHVFPLGRPNP